MSGLPSPLDIATSLVRIPSVNPSFDPTSPGEQEISGWLVEWGTLHGFEVDAPAVLGNRSNVILTHDFGRPGRTLLLNGHTDTVAVDGMSIDPFAGDVRDGRLFGRGASDMKGPLACMLAAMLALKEKPEGCRGRIIVAAVIDEEFRFAGIRHLLQTIKPPDFAIVGEPTRLEVVRGCKGCLRFIVTTHGRAAHSSKPWEGASAILAMAKVIEALQAFFDQELSRVRQEGFGSSTGSIGLIQGGTGVNIVPDQCRIDVDIRLLPGQDGMKVHRQVTETLARVELPAGTTCVVDEPGLCDPAFALSPTDPLVTRMEEILGGRPANVVSFSCDASKVATAGIPCVVCGPGDIAAAHTADESIALADLDAGIDAYIRIARSLLG